MVVDRTLACLELLSDDHAFGFLAGARVHLHHHVADRYGGAVRTVDREAMRRIEDGGGTIYISDVHLLFPEMDELVREVTSNTGAEVWTAMFIGHGRVGLAPHWDDNDVVALHLAGAKVWTLSAPDVDQPIAIQGNWGPHGDSTETFVCTPGTALTIPAGWRHSTESTDVPAIHLMFAHKPRTVWEVARDRLDAAALADARLRAPYEDARIFSSSNLLAEEL